ncbi:aromatic acid exporter family protein [Catellatospora sp. IY07-71]|uniref:FUSC family protein n=1 Tax=Catellatospora sp. IY07-71 TaxID=2728827 RepID=UPI001BB37AA9|nr:FUSC family protein [Catellatospora sp. IY07-71]
MDAAELRRRTGVTLRDRVRRVRASAILTVQAAVAAGLAWYVSHDLLGHVQPFFAPIAAVVTLAISVGQRMRRAFEIVAGNAVGILLGELLILVIGRGAWQVSLVVLLAISLAIFIGGSASLVTQAASSGILVATLLPLSEDYYFSRFVDAVVGGGIALVVMALLLPLNPLTEVQRAVRPLFQALESGLNDAAEALAHGDAAAAQEALDHMREAESHLRAFGESLKAGKELATVAPLHWGKHGLLAAYVDAADHLARALRNSRVLVRRIVSMIRDGEPVPASLVEAVHALAQSVSSLDRELAAAADPEHSRDAAVRALRHARAAHEAGLAFSGEVVFAQLRSTATDLLRATGLPREDAERAVRRAGGRITPPR